MKTGVAAVIAAALLTAAGGCGKKDEMQDRKVGGGGPVPVTVVKSESRNIPWLFDTFGTVEPFSSVDINSMVGGRVQEIAFTPGQKVKKGDVLARIDSRPYEANLKQIQANLERDTVLCADAERQTKLREDLFKKSAGVSEDEVFKAKAVSESLKRSVKINEASLEKAKLDVEYCTIKAPFDGRMGDILIHEGSIIKATDDNIANIASSTPVYVTFSLPERLLPVVQKLIAGGKKLELAARIDAGKEQVESKGELCFIDNTVNQASGTVKMKGLFQNSDEALWPGQFVEVVVDLSVGETYTAIPTDAIQLGQLGQQIFVVKPDSTVELRKVEVERNAAGFSAVSKGLEPGETVVLTGQFRLVPGAKVQVLAPGEDKKAEKSGPDREKGKN